MRTKSFTIVFIGTSSGKTSLKRFHSSLFIKSPEFNLLVDCGDGCAKALLEQKISPISIDGILFSHLHPDHSAGFGSLVVQMKQMKRKKNLKIFCHKNLAETLKLFLSRSFVFAERSGFEIEYREFGHEQKINLAENFKFLSKQNSHLDEYTTYVDEKKSGFASSSFLFDLNHKKIFYSGDISSINDLFLFKDQNPKILISEATHIGWKDLLDFITTAKPEKVYLTHYSDELEKELAHMIKELPKVLTGKIIIADDGFELKI